MKAGGKIFKGPGGNEFKGHSIVYTLAKKKTQDKEEDKEEAEEDDK